jgi:hypothetical protein
LIQLPRLGDIKKVVSEEKVACTDYLHI